MSDLVHTTTHEADGAARLLERFKNTPYFEGILRVVLKRQQAFADVVWALYVGMWLDNAVGAQLDKIGAVVGETRDSRADDLYKLYIRARIKINRANGKVSDTLELARLLLEPTATVAYQPQYPAAYRVEVHGTAVDAVDLAAILNAVRPAGVQLTVAVGADAATAFVWDSTSAAQWWDAGNWGASA